MMAAAAVACKTMGYDAPYGVTAGCIGDGSGSRLLYKFLSEEAESPGDVLTLHYIVPRTKLIKQWWTLFSPGKSGLFSSATRAGCMRSGPRGWRANSISLLPTRRNSPFLSDADALHPAYVRHFISEVDTLDMPRLIARAPRTRGCGEDTLVKGETDYIVKKGETIHDRCRT